MPIHRMVSPPLSPCPPQAGSWCSRLERRPYVRLIVLGNEPRHANGLGPRIPKLPSEFDLCTNESHPLTRSSPCEAPSEVAVHLGSSAGLAARVQGLRRYYALQLEAGNRACLVKVRDDACTVLAEAPCRWTFEEPITLALEVRGADITGFAGGATLHATDDSGAPFENGGVGLVIAEGAFSTDEIRVLPLPEAPVLSER